MYIESGSVGTGVRVGDESGTREVWVQGRSGHGSVERGKWSEGKTLKRLDRGGRPCRQW